MVQINPQIILRATTAYTWVWDDSGTGSDQDGSFWKPTISPSESYLTLVNVVSHSIPTETTYVITSAPDGVLTQPASYNWIWSDKGSSGDHGVTFIQPVAPTGFTCFGDMLLTASISGWDGYKCIRNDYVHTASSGTSTPEWDDKGSGGDYDGRVFKISVESSPFNYYKTLGAYVGDYPSPFYVLYDPTQSPTPAPTPSPTDAPTESPTTGPTQTPTNAPTQSPTNTPTVSPTNAPTMFPIIINDFNVSYQYLYGIYFLNVDNIDYIFDEDIDTKTDINNIIEKSMFNDPNFVYHDFYTNITDIELLDGNNNNLYYMYNISISTTVYILPSQNNLEYVENNLEGSQFVFTANKLFRIFFNNSDALFFIINGPSFSSDSGDTIFSQTLISKFITEYPNEFVLFLIFLSYLLLISIAKCISLKSGNKQFALIKIFLFGIRILDYVSDILTAIVVLEFNIFLAVLLILFSILPGIIAIYLTSRKVNYWIRHSPNGKIIGDWFLDYAFAFYTTCLITGDGVCAMRFFTSHLFNIKLFQLKIKWRQEKELQTILQFTTTLFEHIPQIIIESILIFGSKFTENHSLIAVVALIFNLFSFILSSISYYTKKNALSSGSGSNISMEYNVQLENYNKLQEEL